MEELYTTEAEVLKRPAARVIDDMPGAPRKRPAAAVAECLAPSESASAPRPRYALMFYTASGAYAMLDKESGKQLFQVQVPGVPDGKVKAVAEKAREAMEAGASVADGKELVRAFKEALLNGKDLISK